MVFLQQQLDAFTLHGLLQLRGRLWRADGDRRRLVRVDTQVALPSTKPRFAMTGAYLDIGDNDDMQGIHHMQVHVTGFPGGARTYLACFCMVGGLRANRALTGTGFRGDIILLRVSQVDGRTVINFRAGDAPLCDTIIHRVARRLRRIQRRGSLPPAAISIDLPLPA